jgi:hypothetical protein
MRGHKGSLAGGKGSAGCACHDRAVNAVGGAAPALLSHLASTSRRYWEPTLTSGEMEPAERRARAPHRTRRPNPDIAPGYWRTISSRGKTLAKRGAGCNRCPSLWEGSPRL